MYASTRQRRTFDIWPGFVDALGALLIVVIFVLLLFTMGQFLLTDALSGRDKALAQLNLQIAELADLLSMEELQSEELSERVQQLTATLLSTEQSLQSTARQLSDSQATVSQQASELADLQTDVAALAELKAELEKEVASLAGALDTSRAEADSQRAMSEEAQAQVVLLNRQVKALRDQLGAISDALQVAEAAIKEKDLELEDLGQRLNLALANQVQELAQFRSEFFGRLRQALGNHPDLQVVGDRFVLQSELLFQSGSAELEPQGREQVESLVRTLKDIASRIPPDLDWVLRIDGHTDKRAINTARFPSNWELSTARATAIVKYMEALGIEPSHLAATGFGEHHPLQEGDSASALAANRRIEIKLTSR